MDTWTSPNGVEHVLDGRGRCTTCGRSHPTGRDGAAQFLSALLHLGGRTCADPTWGPVLSHLDAR